jgi:YegS/Rv2252/BmrU family lipid kinase
VLKHLTVIVNPVAGRGRGIRVATALGERLERHGCHVVLRETRGAGDARRFAREVGDVSTVVCVGGDGTVHEVINGLRREGAPPLGIVPCGTGNALGKELRLPRSLDGLADVLLGGRYVPCDVGFESVRRERFLLFASAGYDAQVVHALHAVRTGAIRQASYLRFGLATLRRSPIPRIAVEIDGEIVAHEAAWVHVCNVRAYGGPLVFARDARMDDGLLDVLVLRARGRAAVAGLLALACCSYWRLAVPDRLDVVRARGRRVRLEATGDVPLQIDGEACGGLPALIEIEPAALRILVS